MRKTEHLLFTADDMILFGRHIYKTIADLPGHEPEMSDLKEWVESRKSGFEKSIKEASEKQRSEDHNDIHQKLWDLRLHESMVFKSKPIDGQGPAIDWHVTRVETGWIYHEENPRIVRPPMTFFVPLTNPQTGTI